MIRHAFPKAWSRCSDLISSKRLPTAGSSNRSLELSRNTVSLVKQLARLGLRPSTIVSAGAQILGERFDETRVSRRPIFQGILFWEVFRKLFDCNRPPAFTSFFTNHVAGIMHRYWRDVFPEDFARRRRAATAALPEHDGVRNQGG